MWKSILIWTAAALALAAVIAAAAYTADIRRAYERVRERGAVIASPYGDIEYLEHGSGPAVLVVHGSGGGYDQGELIADAVLGDGFRWIAPSRFGYLRSALPDGATWDDQADAYAFLLDELGIEEVAVVAMSQGGPSALLFAARYPARVSSLTLVSCGVAPADSDDQAAANAKGDSLTAIFKHDLAYWLVTKLFRKRLMNLIGASDDVIAALTPGQQDLFDRFIDGMNPVSLRTAGVTFDNRAALPGGRIAAIVAPTLVLHATDDSLQLYRNAEFAAGHIPNAKLVSFETGGHFLIGVEQAAVRAQVRKHVQNHAGGTLRRIPRPAPPVRQPR